MPGGNRPFAVCLFVCLKEKGPFEQNELQVIIFSSCKHETKVVGLGLQSFLKSFAGEVFLCTDLTLTK